MQERVCLCVPKAIAGGREEAKLGSSGGGRRERMRGCGGGQAKTWWAVGKWAGRGQGMERVRGGQPCEEARRSGTTLLAKGYRVGVCVLGGGGRGGGAQRCLKPSVTSHLSGGRQRRRGGSRRVHAPGTQCTDGTAPPATRPCQHTRLTADSIFMPPADGLSSSTRPLASRLASQGCGHGRGEWGRGTEVHERGRSTRGTVRAARQGQGTRGSSGQRWRRRQAHLGEEVEDGDGEDGAGDGAHDKHPEVGPLVGHQGGAERARRVDGAA